jgi:hypothetical protein
MIKAKSLLAREIANLRLELGDRSRSNDLIVVAG